MELLFILLQHLTNRYFPSTIICRTFVRFAKNIIIERIDVLTSIEFRNNPMFLRNQFYGDGQLDIPKIKKQDIDIENISLIGYNQISPSINKYDDYVHFFIDDYKFESLWNDPEPRISKLSRCKGVLSPQFSTYYTMPQALQIFNTFRSRWCGAYFQSKGLNVIPTIS